MDNTDWFTGCFGLAVVGGIIALRVAFIGFWMWLAYTLVMHLVGG